MPSTRSAHSTGGRRHHSLSVTKELSGICPQDSATPPEMENTGKGVGPSLTLPRQSKPPQLQEGKSLRLSIRP